MDQNNFQDNNQVLPSSTNPEIIIPPTPNIPDTSTIPQPKKKLPKILIGIVIFFCTIGVSLFFTTSNERKLANQFISNISSNKITDAYSQFSTELQLVQSQDTFKSQVNALGLDTSCKLKIYGLSSTSSTRLGTFKTITGSIKCSQIAFNGVEFKFNSNGKLIGYSIQP